MKFIVTIPVNIWQNYIINSLERSAVMPDEMISIVTSGDTPDESPEAPHLEGAKNGGHIGLDWSDAWEPQPNDLTQKQVAKGVDSLRLHNISIKKLEKELVTSCKR
ncbi:hypothetical protein QUB70_19610 [Microcoleus sp. A003_D6]|uniref:hypothetical protein n=1 Tax=Microcoleus sp. A003_D6 TaxID=3055266 RepID=UPI002FD1501D